VWQVECVGRFTAEAGVRLERGTLRCGNGVHLGRHSEVTGRVHLHDGVYVHPHVLLRAFDGFIEIGEGSTVNVFSTIFGSGGVAIGRLVSIGPHVAIVASTKNYRDREIPIKQQGITEQGIVIEDDVWLGAHAVVLDGVRIGRGAVVGAGSVVRQDVPAFAVVAGVPAVVVGERGVDAE
jgi:acetyltransferase-like isoleucine patch superfamily enzyme